MRVVTVALSLGLCVGMAGSVEGAPPVRQAFNAATKTARTAVPLARTSTRVVGARTAVRTFHDASTARSFQGPRTDSFGNVHTATRKLTSDPAYAGLRFDSKVMRTPEGQTFKTTTIIRSDNTIVATPGAKTGSGYMTGIANSAFVKP